MARVLAFAWYVGAVMVLTLALPAVAVVRLVTAPFDPDRRAAGRLLRWFGSALVWIYPPWRVRIEGQLPGGAFVLVANHRSWLDVLVLCRLSREMKWVAKQALFQMPVLGWLFRLSGDIPLVRGDGASTDAALEQVDGYLARGMPVVFFPEGTRSRDGRLRPFKMGAFDTAVKAGVPVVPVALSGTGEGMPAGTLALHASRILIRILAPVSPGADPDAAARLRDQVRESIASQLGAVDQRG